MKELTAVMYLDAPVLNILSMAGLGERKSENLDKVWREIVATYGVYEENGKVLEEYYKEHGGTIKVIAKSMCEHHPHGLEDVTPIVEFVEKFL